MDELTLLRAMNGIHEEDVVMAGKIYFNENTARKTSKRLFTLALAAALLLALGAAAYAVWSIHISRQQDLRSDLKIEENNASSYTEYDVTQQEKAGSASSLVLLSAVNDGTEQRIYVDVSPVAKENIARVVSYYPGLMKLRSSAEDALRAKDVQANAARMELAKTLSREEYFQKLGIKLVYSVNDETQIPRVAELFGKTNQFILSYKRYKETDVRSFMRDNGKCVITIHMSDSLSDSGIIAILAAHAENGVLTADELTVSCRALGRNLEDVMLPELFRLAQRHLNAKKQMEIPYLKGERNMPALKWLAALTGTETGERGTAVYEIPEHVDLSGLTVEVRE